MSQKVAKKGTLQEKEEKSETPVKDIKKKMAVNAEKEKQTADKIADKHTDKATDKPSDKPTTKPSDKPIEKPTAKSTDKPTDKPAAKPVDKPTDKNADKNTEKDKKTDKQADKKSVTQEKAKDDSNKGETSGKEKQEKKEQSRTTKQNGKPHNGVTDVTLNSNGDCDSVLNGSTVSDTDDEEAVLVIEENDELFPELTYDDASDVECFESPTPECLPSRSLTRRSQAKVTRTPETPRPASDKQPEKEPTEESKDPKSPKLKEDAPTNMKLRSADSPKPAEAKKGQETKKGPETHKESPKKGQDEMKESPKKNQDAKHDKKHDNAEKSQEIPDKRHEETENENEKSPVDIEVEVVVENESGQENRKTDTNYSKSRVKVSPYRRSLRIADQTNSSLIANYTGNNTTMEMDITESSVAEEGLDDSSYLSGLRNIRGRRSYKPLKEMALRHIDRSARSVTSATSATSETVSRPTGTVVGRKRKPDAGELECADESGAGELPGKRVRLLERLALPFRRTVTSTPIPRRTPEIVGINSDLPLTAPVASETFDPEALKPEVLAAPAAPVASLAPTDKDNKRCSIM